MRTSGKNFVDLAVLFCAIKHSGVSRDVFFHEAAAVYDEPQAKANNFPTWMTIQLGTGLTTADDFRRAFKADGHRFGCWANNMLNQPTFTVAKKKTEVELVKVTVTELGFKNSASFADICKRAAELGLERCPAEVGPQLRLQYRDQPMGEWLLIAMKPIADSVGDLGVFSVDRGEVGSWLGGYDGEPGSFWSGGSAWVFIRRK